MDYLVPRKTRSVAAFRHERLKPHARKSAILRLLARPHQGLPGPDGALDDGVVESMYQSPGESVVGCQDPRAELPTEVAVEAAPQMAGQRLVGVLPVRLSLRGKG